MEGDLPPFFETLPILLLHKRIESGVIGGRLLLKYKEQLGKLLSNEARPPVLVMEGVELYKLSASPEYSFKFGVDSYYMRKFPPTDWFVAICECNISTSLKIKFYFDVC
jgi:hypothetical protein